MDSRPRRADVPDRPVFIVGIGRSGSTVFFDVLTHHPGVAWLSSLSQRFPDKPELNRWLFRLADLGPLRGLAYRIGRPHEAWRFWRHHASGFVMPFRDLGADDLTAFERDRLRAAFARMTTRRRQRLLVKITGWPRIGYLNALFPEASFIHIVRDGRAVANSFLQMPWWGGWGGTSNWRYGELTAEAQAEWDAHGRSFVALAGIQWKLLMEAFESGRRAIPEERALEIRYEDLCESPKRAFERCVDFCELSWDRGLERAIHEAGFRSANERWRRDLTPRQQGILEAVLGRALERYGYR